MYTLFEYVCEDEDSFLLVSPSDAFLFFERIHLSLGGGVLIDRPQFERIFLFLLEYNSKSKYNRQ